MFCMFYITLMSFPHVFGPRNRIKTIKHSQSLSSTLTGSFRIVPVFLLSADFEA